jgi:aryl-alcohol dehydrogenase-like predicted oxidoreductase
MTATRYRKLGPWNILGLGLGGMPLSIEGRPSREQAISVIHRALDLGINHIDTAFAYYLAGGTHQNGEEQHNEKLIAEALKTYQGTMPKENITVASKVGHFRYMDSNGQPKWGQQGCSRYILETGKMSRDALEVDAIDLYYYHRPDLNVPFEESIDAMSKLLEEGIIKYAGISNVSIQQIQYTKSVLGDKFIAVQNQFSPAHTQTLDTLKYCQEQDLTFFCWSPLGGFRNPELFVKDAPFEQIGQKYGVSKQKVILAWELAKGNNVVPIPGFRRFETLEDSITALDFDLNAEDLAFLG